MNLRLTLQEIQNIETICEAGLRILNSTTKSDKTHSKRIREGAYAKLKAFLVTNTAILNSGFFHGQFGNYLSSVYSSQTVYVSQDVMNTNAYEINILSTGKLGYRFIVDPTLPQSSFKPEEHFDSLTQSRISLVYHFSFETLTP